jgi:hypothetical protein
MDVHQSTASYEAWLRSHTAVVRRDLALKHQLMRRTPFLFLRATFYRWIQLWADACPELLDAVPVEAIGDLHVENFGTWRDREGRLVWGVTDVDEACTLPYTHDLTRLAASALLARRAGRLSVSRADICRAILTGYRQGLEAGGNPIVLAEHRGWLRDIAIEEMDNPKRFWKTLTRLTPARAGAPRALLAEAMSETTTCRFYTRTAGVGSLGRPRFVALATWNGGFIAREAKARVPSAAAWLKHPRWTALDGPAVLARACRAADPFFVATQEWTVRRLAPDCTKINLEDMPKRRDEKRLLQSMGWETANIHVAAEPARILSDLQRRPSRWLTEAATTMSEVLVRDWAVWREK